MTIDYLAHFPIQATQLPDRLRALLEPVGNSPRQRVEVTSRYEFEKYGPKREYVHMIMAVVPDHEPDVTPLLEESGNGVAFFSVPYADKKGSSRDLAPSVSGYDYIIASWGNGSFYTFNLAEKVWMALGLTPRCVGNDHQRMIYDDLSLPEFGVAEGEVSNEFYWTQKRNVSWKMSNEYLRKYLWMRGCYGVRVFYYEALLQDGPELRSLMNEKTHFSIKPKGGWYDLVIQEYQNGLLIQVWATVKAIPPELCLEQNANNIAWPGFDGPMTQARANTLRHAPVFLSDTFLQRYEQNSSYGTTPVVDKYGRWLCSPSYRGQWSFSECIRVGRNFIQVPMYALYKGIPDREILHAHAFALSSEDVAHFDLKKEHIASKTKRLLDQLLKLGENLSALASIVGIHKAADDLSGFSRDEIRANGWAGYPQIARLAQVAPLDMSQQDFLSRCKSLHEIWQRIPDGFLKKLLKKAGCAHDSIKDLKSLKLLEALLNIVEGLNTNEEAREAFQNNLVPEGWNSRNAAMAALFLNYDLRNADAHEAIGKSLHKLQKLGFDTARVNEGYGSALDFVMDGVIDGFTAINVAVSSLLARSE